jgi:hypothetical protein
MQTTIPQIQLKMDKKMDLIINTFGIYLHQNGEPYGTINHVQLLQFSVNNCNRSKNRNHCIDCCYKFICV